MNVVVSVDALVPPITGVGRYTRELVARLPKCEGVDRVRFWRAHVWVPSVESFTADPRWHTRRSRIPGPLRPWYWRRALRGSVFHAPNFFLPAEADIGVITVHDLSVLRFPQTHPEERIRAYERSFRRSLERAVHLITPTETVREEVVSFLSWPRERVCAVPNGVSSEYRPRPPAETAPVLRSLALKPGRYVLFVSTIEPRKGLDALLDAYERLPPGFRAAYPLVVAGGKGWRSEALHERLETAQAAGWARYLGFVPEPALPLLYSGARLFAYPSVYEGFGLPLAEAMASGVPVVAANRSCLPETAGGAARLLDVDDAANFAEAIRAGIDDPVWRRTAVDTGLAVASRYTWDSNVRGTVAAYRKAFALERK